MFDNRRVNCGIEEHALNGMVSELLCLSPRIVKPLTEVVFNKTRGNPLFIHQTLLSLNRDGLLNVDFTRKRYVWNESKIWSAKLPDDVATCFTRGIGKLPTEVQSALHTLASFGASAKLEYLDVIESELRLQLTEPLKIAVAEGLVIKQNGMYRFCHDKIQAACYDIMGRSFVVRTI
jgi:predicted ATPase